MSEKKSWVREVLVALGVEPVREERARIWALCPFHQNRKDPKSWATAFFVRLSGKRRDLDGKVYEAAGQFFCFSCGEGGPMRRLVMALRNVDEDAAAAFIKKRGGERGSKVEELRRVVEVVRRERPGRARYALPREVILDPLRKWVGPAQEYARGRCQLTDEEVELFGLGYAVDGPKLGARIVFPWRGIGGVVGGYSARTFVDAEPKYTTPGPDELGVDHSILFGEHLWPYDERKIVVVTEGALNGLAARRALLDLEPKGQLASIGGTKNFEPEHGKKLATFPLALVLTDPDAAGNAAALAIEMMVGRYTRLQRVRLPKNVDALDAGRELLRERIRRALRRLSC